MSRKAEAHNKRSVNQYLLMGDFSAWALPLGVPDPLGARRRPGAALHTDFLAGLPPEHHFLFPRGWAPHHQQV